MKKPNISQKFNLTFWLWVAENLEISQQFEERGNERQRRDLRLAQKYLKWLDIQKKEDREYFAKQLKKRPRRKKIKTRKRRKQ